MKKILVSACAIALFATSCKKESNASVNPTKENVAGNYKYTSITLKMGNNPEANYMDTYLDDCQKDDIVSLNVNGKYTVIDGAVSCGGPVEEGEWNIVNSTTFQKDGDNYTIEKFDGTTLQISQTDNSMGMQMKLTFVAKKQ